MERIKFTEISTIARVYEIAITPEVEKELERQEIDLKDEVDVAGTVASFVPFEDWKETQSLTVENYWQDEEIIAKGRKE